jgi:SagB-type dehydrogenase family enzyme
MSRSVSDKTGLSRLYHLNSEPWLNEQAGRPPPLVQQAKSYVDVPRVALPETDGGVLDKLAASRHSMRAFRDEPPGLDDFAALIRSGYAALGPDVLENGQRLLRRPVPSAGGLYPLEVYALVRNVTGLQRGIYHYDAVGDALEAIDTTPWEEQASDAFLSWPAIKNAPVILCLGATFARTQSKYGPRGYRYVLLEAGHVAQNLCLSAVELGLSSLCLGGYHDAQLNRLIGLDGEDEAIVYAIALGVAAGD